MTDRVLRRALALAVAALVAGGAASLTPPGIGAAEAAAPRIGSPSAIAVETSTGDVVYARRADTQRGIASTTKLMTALIALERVPRLSRQFDVPGYAATPAESLAGLHAGDRMTMRDLLGAMLLPSGNDAATAIAKDVGGSLSRFVALMNDRARALHLRARFRNPVGLDAPGHHASAADLVKLTLLLRRYPAFRTIVDERSMRLDSATPPITVENRNRLVLGYPWVDGVKTGHTGSSGYALVGSGRRRDVSVVTAVLGASSEAERDADSLALLRYALSRYHRVSPVRQGTEVARLPLRYRDERVSVVAAGDVRRTARRTERITTRTVGLPADVEGPLPRGARLGTIEVVQRARVVARVPAVTASAVARATFWERADENLGRRGVQVLLGVGLLCLVTLALLLRRSPRLRRQPDGAAP